jgi:hypothetical protein
MKRAMYSAANKLTKMDLGMPMLTCQLQEFSANTGTPRSI